MRSGSIVQQLIGCCIAAAMMLAVFAAQPMSASATMEQIGGSCHRCGCEVKCQDVGCGGEGTYLRCFDQEENGGKCEWDSSTQPCSTGSACDSRRDGTYDTVCQNDDCIDPNQ